MSIEPATDWALENIRGRITDLERSTTRPIELLSGRIAALADRVTVLEAAFAEQHAINESVSNTLNSILAGLK